MNDRRKERIRDLILKNFSIHHLDVVNESHMHSVPVNSETHFKIVLVTEQFQGQSRIQRSRLINDLLKSEFSSGLHALALKLYTSNEWAKLSDQNDQLLQSPQCHSKAKTK